MMRVATMAVMALAASVPLAGAQEVDVDVVERERSAAMAAAYALLAPDVAHMAVRTDVAVTETGDLLLRVTPSDPAAEWAPLRARAAVWVEARIARDGEARVSRVTVTGSLTSQPPVRVLATATETQRRAALRTVRYGTSARSDVLALAARRPWTVLGETATVEDATLVWRAAAEAGRLEPVWRVAVRVGTERGDAPFVGVFDAVDGRLLDVTREDR
jgi:hypothetical protein